MPEQADWSLGDLVVAPHGILWEGESPGPLTASRGLGERVWRALWRVSPTGVAVSVEAGWDLGMVVLDDCALDRDFNREVNRRERDLRAGGLPAEAARERAEAETCEVEGLDPTLIVARVRPYGEFEVGRHDSLRRAATFGYFPVLGTDEVDEGVVELQHRHHGPSAHLPRPGRIAFRDRLQWASLEARRVHALRARSTEAAIEAAVGRFITDAQAYRERHGKRESLVVRLELDHGTQVLVLRDS